MSIITTTIEEPTGPYVTSLPMFLHSAGVAGYSNRFIADKLAGADASAVASWADATASTGTIAQATGTAQPAIATVGGRKVVSFDGTSDKINSAALTPYKSVALVLKMSSALGVERGISQSADGDFSIRRDSSNRPAVNLPGAGSIALTTTNTLASWVVVAASWDSTTGRLWVKGTGAADTASVATVGFAVNELQLGFGNGFFGAYQIVEAITWPTTLLEADFALVYTAMSQHYSTLFV